MLLERRTKSSLPLNRRVALAIVACMVSMSAFAVDCTPAALREALATHADADQAARKAVIANPSDKSAYEAALSVDATNTAWMREVVAQCKWPKQSDVGKEGAMHAWLMAQHADMAPDFQVVAAAAMKDAVLVGEANGGALSRLVDRNRLLQKQPQVYAMNPDVTADKTLRFNVEDPANLDVRRKEIGLVPFYCLALELSESRELPIEWPQGVLLVPTDCPKAE